MQKQTITVMADNQQLRVVIFGDMIKDAPCIVLLHGGLDCIETWKDFPKEVVKATGLAVVVYERFGHGQSGQLNGEIRDINYRHHEANVVLPQILGELGIQRVILVGHSDGGAIALLAPKSLGEIVVGVCAISPPLVAEETVRAGIKNAVTHYESGHLSKKLKLFHGDATEGLFYSWANTWMSEAFDNWSCDDDLGAIRCPVSLIFGLADEYGHQPSLDLLQARLMNAPDVTLIENSGHLSHHFARKEVLESIKHLIEKIAL